MDTKHIKISDYNYDLPDERIAKFPISQRDHSKLLVYTHGEVSDDVFFHLPDYHHIPYLYAWTSQPWKTQFWTREIVDRMYRNDINGLGGNDDCGQMSAWYMFTVMGFYPVCPGTDQYVLGAPYFPYLKLHLPNGKTLEIKAPGVSDSRRYVQSLTINGKKYEKLYVTHADLLEGGVWEFKMGASPNKKRGQKTEYKPYSLTNGIK